MAIRNFRDLLGAQWAAGRFACVGLDSKLSRIPAAGGGARIGEIMYRFNREIVCATRDLICAYKLNSAFYEAEGNVGLAVLQRTIAFIHEIAPEVLVILDAKRGDIGNTNVGYVRAAFEILDADAITVSPYFGGDALRPFLDEANKGILVFCKTSNPGAEEFQDLDVPVDREEGEFLAHARVWKVGFGTAPMGYRTSLSHHVAYRVAHHWNKNSNCGVVVGATCPKDLADIRRIAGDMPILIPGIGTQGGDVQKVVAAGTDSRGEGMIINSGSAIIFASPGQDFAAAARRETEKLCDAIRAALNPVGAADVRK